MLAFVPEMLTSFDLHDVFRRQIAHAFDVRQRERIGLFTDFYHQTAHHRKRQRHFQMETAALARRLLQHHGPTQLANHVLNSVETDAAPGHFGNLVAQAEARQKQEGQQFLIAQLRCGFGWG